jgi:soluble lytic murein transglycosylase-like protein
VRRVDLVRLFAVLFVGFAGVPCAADIYGFVDENGVAHLSDRRLDERYYLFARAAPRPPVEVQAEAPGAPALESPRGPVAETAPALPSAHPATAARRERYAVMIANVAQEERVERALLHAVIAVESAYDSRARSPKGAMGLMQLMPATAERYGVGDAWNPQQNLRAGARYLRDLLAMFNNDLKLALAAYNAGEGAVMRFGRRIPPFAETRNYVPRVLQHYERYRSASAPHERTAHTVRTAR